MTDFNDILKDKLEEFEVPYNDAHWAEMEGKLNKAQRLVQIKRGLYITVGIVAILGVASYFYSQQEKTGELQGSETITSENLSERILTEEKSFSKKGYTPALAKLENEQKLNRTTINNNAEEVRVVAKETPGLISEMNSKETKLFVEEQENKTNDQAKGEVEIPETDFIVFNGNSCLGGEVSFETLENKQTMSYLWDFGDGNTSDAVNPTHTYKESGEYDVSLILTDETTGKNYKSIIRNAVNIYPKPVADFKWEEIALKQDNNKLKYPYTEFEVKSNGDDQYQWDFGNGSKSTEKSPKEVFRDAKFYDVTLTTKNAYECFNKETKTIQIKRNFTLNAPDAFRPSGNRNKTKVFIPLALLGWDVQFELSITNKLGNLVYKTTDKNAPWNGRLNNTGNVLNHGTYLWQVVTYDIDGVQHQHNGKIKLLED